MKLENVKQRGSFPFNLVYSGPNVVADCTNKKCLGCWFYPWLVDSMLPVACSSLIRRDIGYARLPVKEKHGNER
jgi:hypothetical protein